ncbi:MAG: M20/M25/M40 family metallo-hydrolase, partial [Bacteroidota bacterium]
VVPGVRHICGHDVHVAVGLGIAEAFAATRDEWPGTVMLIFQPAEERGTGANAMLRDNVFEPMPPDAIFAVHTTPYPVGTLATAPGAMMAGRALVNVTLQGPGNVEEAAATVRQALLSLSTVPPNQMMDTAPPGFIFVQLFNPALSVSSEDAGSSSEATVGGQIMTLGAEDRARAKALALEALQSADLGDATLEVTYNDRFLEGVTNDSALVELANAAIETHVPSVDVQRVDGAIPVFSEDFGSFQARTPGIMYYLGVSNPEAGTVGMPHTPNYVADDAAILVGSRAITAAMLERLMAE